VGNYLLDKAISGVMRKSIIEIYKSIETSQIISRKDIAAVLNCSERNASKIMKIMKSLDLFTPVQGKGKGKYVFKNIE